MPEPAKYKLDPRHLLQGITGADHSLPTFDGLSTDPKDHLMDFDTDSMEKHADVRVYFWQVGDELQRLGSEFIARPDLDPPADLQERILYDAKLVRKGREFLKESRADGQGYYVSPQRDILANNHPGDPWYRLPAVGIAKLLGREVDAVSSEGSFYHYMTSDPKHWSIGSYLKTNIRLPVIWESALKNDVVRGTAGWDIAAACPYKYRLHPAYQTREDDWNNEAIWGLFMGLHYAPNNSLLDFDSVVAIINRDWPWANEPESEEEWVGPSLLEVQGSSVAKFFGRDK